ncbi:PREDICTED: tetraspanin-9 [Dipodomys ordii]|uniref:Tetraspanin-9 n=1 Tax=Dipodomys ordii TaxID=10020 RepID=A0A1S3FR75_DIPOR|nr:PREDICTED: tetraspanin-9 [Dipodomys ordii]
MGAMVVLETHGLLAGPKGCVTKPVHPRGRPRGERAVLPVGGARRGGRDLPASRPHPPVRRPHWPGWGPGVRPGRPGSFQGPVPVSSVPDDFVLSVSHFWAPRFGAHPPALLFPPLTPAVWPLDAARGFRGDGLGGWCHRCQVILPSPADLPPGSGRGAPQCPHLFWIVGDPAAKANGGPGPIRGAPGPSGEPRSALWPLACRGFLVWPPPLRFAPGPQLAVSLLPQAPAIWWPVAGPGRVWQQLCGCGLLGVGIWLSVSQGNFATFSPSFPSLSAANLVIALGAVVMVTGFLGCLGAIKENKCLLLSGCYEKMKMWFEDHRHVLGAVGMCVLVMQVRPGTAQARPKPGPQSPKGPPRAQACPGGTAETQVELWPLRTPSLCPRPGPRREELGEREGVDSGVRQGR